MHDNTCEQQPGVSAGQLTSPTASWMALSMSFGLTSSCFATCFSPFSAALPPACSIVLSLR
jgi:glycerol uptake facilitator-like aquaporin